MLTQIEYARKGKITDKVKTVAKNEYVSARYVSEMLACGKIVIPANVNRRVERLCGIGKGLKVKVNANIGNSRDVSNLDSELKKLKVCMDTGADAVMDLSTGSDVDNVRKKILDLSKIPVGTVPIYQSVTSNKNIGNILGSDMINSVEKHAKDGVDFVTIHSGVTRSLLPQIIKSKRILGVVSRGGAILANWMKKTGLENPFYEHFDKLIEIAHEYDITLSLGDGLRPGSVLDATDDLQMQELRTLAKLAKKAIKSGVGVMIEGPGHVPLDQIKYNMMMQKKLCNEAPFYVLGPLVTDCAVGYDHIAGAIGGTLAGFYGADFLCYVTPSEHIGLPDIEDVREGILAFKIAAHSADIALNKPHAMDRDRELSIARKQRDWQKQKSLCFNPEKFEKYHKRNKTNLKDVCSMCSDLCSMKMLEEIGC